VRPQGSDSTSNRGDFISNFVAISLNNADELDVVAERLEREVGDIEVVDRKTAYEATPGYTAQQSTLDTQRYFTFIIGLLVIGGFFQIQTLQKVAQIGMLKAIGTTTRTIALSAIVQILLVNSFGVLIGTAGSLALAQTFPPVVPIVFTGEAVASAMLALLLIGPVGGLLSVWLLLRVEPLTALGLAQ
jgi:putative ABC transport system permease protein